MSQDFFLLKTNLKLEALKDESRTKGNKSHDITIGFEQFSKSNFYITASTWKKKIKQKNREKISENRKYFNCWPLT